MLVLLPIFAVLTFVALLPVVVIVLGEFPGSFIEKVEALVSTYDGVMISLGTLFLVSFLAFLTTLLSNKKADRQEAANRKIAAQLKIGEFRQAWINDLRNQLSTYYAKTITAGEMHDDWEELALLSGKIRLLMNADDVDYDRLVDVLRELTKAMEARDEEIGQIADELLKTSQHILKREWDRLKNDLGSIDGVRL